MDLFFRVNVNEKIGFGHFRRITSLIENLPKRINYKIILDNKQQINKYNLPNMNYSFLYKDNKSFLSERDDAKLFCSLIKKKPIVFVDDYRLGKIWEKTVSTKSLKLITICDYIQKKHYSDLLINTKPYLSNNKQNSYLEIIKKNNKKRCIFLLGHNFALIPSDRRKRITKKNSSFNVTFYNGGSGDPSIFFKVIESLLRNKDKFKVNLIIGNLVKKKYSYLKTLNKKKKLNIIYNKKIQETLVNTNLLISSAGLMFYEASYLKVPTIFFQLNQNQELKNIDVTKFGHLFLLERKDLSNTQKLSDLIIIIKKNYNRIKKIVNNPENKIDGLGSKRILNRII